MSVEQGGGGRRLYDALSLLRRRIAPNGTRRDALVRVALASTVAAVERLAGTDHSDRSAEKHVAPLGFLDERARIAGRWIRGAGLEIGGLHLPMQLPPGTTVRYVDRAPVPELRLHYPELSKYALVEPDLIDDGERLGSVADASVDFVVANHFIEHCRDPVAAIENAVRVVRPRGVVFMAVPDKRETFDRARPVTTLEHVIRDHEEGPGWSERAHFEEWADLVDHGPGGRPDVDDLIRQDASIHFHVWTPLAFLDVVRHCRETLGMPFDLSLFQQNGPELVVVLTRLEGVTWEP